MSTDKQTENLEFTDTNTENVNDTSTENVNTTSPNPNNKRPSMKEKFSYIFSKDFIIIVLLGQFLSFCITSTIVSNGVLSKPPNEANYPTTQTLFTYIVLFLIYTPITIYKKGFNGWASMFKSHWWKYLLLSLFDVEGNYFIVKSYQFTSVLSIMLLDAWTVPCVVILSILFLKIKFHWSQYLGVLICLVGIAALIGGDIALGKDIHSATNIILGDIFCLIAATCYAISNVSEQFLVERRPLYEVIGQMGFWGCIISAIQLSIFEREELANSKLSGEIVGLNIAYTITMVFFYTGAPILFRLSSATFFNISLLTSDFYTLSFGVYLFKEPMHYLYGVAFAGTMVGIAIYNIYPAIKPKVKVEKDDERKGEKDTEANHETSH